MAPWVWAVIGLGGLLAIVVGISVILMLLAVGNTRDEMADRDQEMKDLIAWRER